MWMDLLLAVFAVAPLLPVTHKQVRSGASSGIKMPEDTSILLVALQASPTGLPRQ